MIALGNGTGCRETEEFLNNLFEKRVIDNRYVRYCIVSEQGASIYSCSSIAKEEFPDLDVSYIGAISIARRLSDPLCELVKVEPKHLGNSIIYLSTYFDLYYLILFKRCWYVPA